MESLILILLMGAIFLWGGYKTAKRFKKSLKGNGCEDCSHCDPQKKSSCSIVKNDLIQDIGEMNKDD